MQTLTPKQELFCQGLAKGLTQAAAYEAAGFRPDSANCSSRLLKKALIDADSGRTTAF